MISRQKKVGSNDPCLCGSGKKYKKCCFASDMHAEQKYADLHRMIDVRQRLMDRHLVPYLSGLVPEDKLKVAMVEFLPNGFPVSQWRPNRELEEEMFEQLFLWLIFSWRSDNCPTERVIAMQYLHDFGKKLTQEERQFIKMACQAHYGFYMVEKVTMDGQIHVQDILLDEDHIVQEHIISCHLQCGDILFCQLLTLHGNAIFHSWFPSILPPRSYADLFDLRNSLQKDFGQPLTASALRDQHYQVLHDAFIRIAFASAVLSELQDICDEELCVYKLYFMLSVDLKTAVQKLLPLTQQKSADAILSQAQRDSEGNLVQVYMHWQQRSNQGQDKWSDMGDIFLKNSSLVAQVETQELADRFRFLVENYLDGQVVYDGMKKTSCDQSESEYE